MGCSADGGVLNDGHDAHRAASGRDGEARVGQRAPRQPPQRVARHVLHLHRDAADRTRRTDRRGDLFAM